MNTFISLLKGKTRRLCTAVLSLAIAAQLLTACEDSFRTIVIDQLTGTVSVTTDRHADLPGYEGMGLFSGNRISVSPDSSVMLKLDTNKFMLAEAGTVFSLEASGEAGNDQTVIRMENGSTVTTLQCSLGKEQSFIVQTPISTVSVRGTTFRIGITEDAEGLMLVTHQCYGGTIDVTPIDQSGKPVGTAQMVQEGHTIQIRAAKDSGAPTFVTPQPEAIDYETLENATVLVLLDYIDGGSLLAEDRAFYEQFLHTHTFSKAWASDALHHWHDASCTHQGEIRSSEATHTFDDGKITAEPTETANGTRTYTCSVCGFTKSENIPPIGHTHSYSTWQFTADTAEHVRTCSCGAEERELHFLDSGTVTTAATHTKEGVRTYLCYVCGYTATESIPTEAGHSWGAWQTASKTSTFHIRKCACGETEQQPHTWTNGTVTSEATHTTPGVRSYRCTVCQHVREESLPTTEQHTYGDWLPSSADSSLHERNCACGKTEQAPHQWDAGSVTRPATADAAGLMTYRCTVCEKERTEEIAVLAHTHTWSEVWTSDAAEHWHASLCSHTPAVRKDAAPHTWNKGVVLTEATHTQPGSIRYTCTVCAATRTAVLDPLPQHSYGEWTPSKDDSNTHTQVCACGDVRTELHKLDEGTVITKATHTQEGQTEHHCTVCGYTAVSAVPALPNHDWGVWELDPQDPGLHTRWCNCGMTQTEWHTWDEGSVLQQATPTQEGRIEYTCQKCHHSYTETTPALTDPTSGT